MGRPQKEGLKFFPCDVDILDDEKVQYITARFGAKGDGIFLRILCRVYRQGYALPFDEDAARLVARSVGDIGLDGLVMDVVHESLKRGLFNEGIFKQFGLLTSRGIQNRYIKICKDSKRKNYKIPDYLNLTTENCSFTPEETPKIPEETPQRKEKQSKDISNDISRTRKEKMFNEFWNVYPKKRSKGEAQKAFNKLLLTEDLFTQILKAVSTQIKSKEWLDEDGQYIPYPAKWINQQRWLDDIKPQPSGGGDLMKRAIIAKNKEGSTGRVAMRFDGEKQNFFELDAAHGEDDG